MILIYSGAVEVLAAEMRPFVKAAKYLKLQGFENITPTVSINDIQGGGQTQPHRNYSIILKRIDETEIAMVTPNGANDEPIDDSSTSRPATNGDDATTGENNCGTSSSDDSCGNGGIDDINSGNKIFNLTNGFPLSTSESSSSSSEGELFGKTNYLPLHLT